MSMLEVKDIYKKFGKIEVLKGIDFELNKGEVLSIIGSSGSGKTTLLRCLTYLETAEEGTVFVDGNCVFDAKAEKHVSAQEARKRQLNFGLVFQSFNLFPQYTVLDNVCLAPKLLAKERDDYRTNKKAIFEEIEDNARRLIERVGMTSRIDMYPCQLSGGQQQRVAIARALVCDPDVVLLDEPLGALDLKLRKDMQIELKKIQQKTKKTFVYVTHDQEEALTMSDRVVVMNNGVIAQIGTPTDIYNEPANAFVADFIGEANIINGVMLDDCKVELLGQTLTCVDKGFPKNSPVDVVIRPEDIEVVSPEASVLVGKVEDTIFKGVHYEMSVKCNKCQWIIHSTVAQKVGDTIGMTVSPDNIHIMPKMFLLPNNEIFTTVLYSDEEANTITISIEENEIEVPNCYYKEGTKLHIILPPTGLHIAGDGVGDLDEVYIESVIWKGEHNEIILESDERKWLMQSDQDEQVATYVPVSFDFSKATFEVIEEEGEADEI